MLGFFLGFALFEWIAIAAAIVFVLISISAYTHDAYGPSSGFMIASIAALGYLFKGDLLPYYQAHGWFMGILIPVLAYLIVGFGVSFVNWIFFCMRAKEKYRQRVLSVLTSERGMTGVQTDILEQLQRNDKKVVASDISDTFVKLAIQANEVCDHRKEIFGYSYSGPKKSFVYSDLRNHTIESAQTRIAVVLEDALPPKAAYGKVILTSAVFEWPITLLSLVFSRVLTVVVDKVIYASHKSFDKVSSWSFGSSDINI